MQLLFFLCSNSIPNFSTISNLNAGKKLYNTAGSRAANNLCDVALDGWYCAEAKDIIDTAKPTPWTLSDAAIKIYKGARGVVPSPIDLANQPRKAGTRCDLGCFENQTVNSFMLLVK